MLAMCGSYINRKHLLQGFSTYEGLGSASAQERVTA